MSKKIELDGIYANTISFANDLKILGKTIKQVIKADGIVEETVGD